MEDLIVTRVFIEATEEEIIPGRTPEIKSNKLALDLSTIYFYEEYAGKEFNSFNKPLTTVYFDNGEALVILMSFTNFYKVINKFKKERHHRTLFKNN